MRIPEGYLFTTVCSISLIANEGGMEEGWREDMERGRVKEGGRREVN